MSGTRFARLSISALEAWDAPLETNIDNVLGPNPFAMPEVATEGSLPAANTMRNCWVMVQDYQSTGKPALARSDGASWHFHTSWRSEHTLGGDAATWDIIEPAIPVFSSFEARLTVTQNGSGTPAPQLLLGDATSFDTGAVYSSERWCVASSSMAQTSSNAAAAVLLFPSGTTCLQNYQLSVTFRAVRNSGLVWVLHGETQIALLDGSTSVAGGSFRALYGGSKTVDRFQLGLPASTIDSASARCELFFN